jgi:hypothetical protein
MKTLITEFISLDGVVQAPGGASEDTDGGFSHGGWSMKYFDPVVMGGLYAELAAQSDALLQGRRTYQASAEAWPGRAGDPFTAAPEPERQASRHGGVASPSRVSQRRHRLHKAR